MYVVDITRDDDLENDMLIGNDSMSAKSKTINYVMDYVFANYNINLNKDVLDQNLNIDRFSLKQFLNDNYKINIKNDLKIQAVPTDKDHCLFLKSINSQDDFPSLYTFSNKNKKQAQAYMKYLINDALINKYHDDISEYDRLRVDYNKSIESFSDSYIKCEIISLYKGGLFLEELLNNACSYKQIKNKIISISI